MLLNVKKLVDVLLSWYDEQGRDLPWRKAPSPYHVWVSEIMLQQTQVTTVIPYYERFITLLPTVHELATIDEGALLKLWEGLGYYSRARHLKKAAALVVSDWDGQLPGDYQTLQKLPGIGPYTAGAIASIAFGERVSAVDGNVLRILSRLLLDDFPINLASARKHYTPFAESLVPAHRPGDFNQALMDVGAMRCLAKGVPLCQSCPLQTFCLAHQNKQETALPIRQKKKARTVEERTIVLLRKGQYIYLVKRPEKGLLAGMWEFLNFQGNWDELSLKERFQQDGILCDAIIPLGKSEHLFTHRHWKMTGFLVKMTEGPSLPGKWVTRNELELSYPLPKAFQYYYTLLMNDSAF